MFRITNVSLLLLLSIHRRCRNVICDDRRRHIGQQYYTDYTYLDDSASGHFRLHLVEWWNKHSLFFLCVCATMVRSLNCVYAIGSFLTERAVYFLINIVINSRKHRAKHRDHSNNKNYEIQSKRSERERNNESQAHIIIIARKRNSSDKCTWANKVVEIIIMIIDSTIERVRVSRWKSDRQRRFAAATTSTISRLLFLLHFSLSLSLSFCCFCCWLFSCGFVVRFIITCRISFTKT